MYKCMQVILYICAIVGITPACSHQIEHCDFCGGESLYSAVCIKGEPHGGYNWAFPHLLALCNDYENTERRPSEDFSSLGMEHIQFKVLITVNLLPQCNIHTALWVSGV